MEGAIMHNLTDLGFSTLQWTILKILWILLQALIDYWIHGVTPAYIYVSGSMILMNIS